MKPVVLSRSQHSISRKHIDRDALKVLYRLHKNGYIAYLVGGSVRDLLLGRTPKDFDIVTNARPNRVRKLFRNAYLIGRRFRLVHVKFKHQIIEVSTFRKTPHHQNGNDDDLLLRRENTFGTPVQDAQRRDFTINGLFYNIADFTIIDHVNGLEDITHRCVRCIGDPDKRFREDPVRMIRAIRVAARLGFRIENTAWDGILSLGAEVLKCAPARLLEEMFHLLKHGSAAESTKRLHQSRLMEHLMPELSKHYSDAVSSNFHLDILRNLDKLTGDHPFKSPALIMACVFFPMVNHTTGYLRSGEDLRTRVENCLKPQTQRFNFPRRYFDRMVQICIAQRWFSSNRKRRFRPMAFIKRNFFGEAFTLYCLHRMGNGDTQSNSLDIWYERIKSADIPDAYKQDLLSVTSLPSEP
ncbi:polynucleotide adenylyltransferase PcnB [bacterium]|nr:polynucleotide adenylyltransferase PcnB [candidate division CSSED10-310 bacterium]